MSGEEGGVGGLVVGDAREWARLDPENRRRIAALLRDRPRRLALLNSHAHRAYWPRTLAQVGPMTRAMADELAAELGDDHPHVRALRGQA